LSVLPALIVILLFGAVLRLFCAARAAALTQSGIAAIAPMVSMSMYLTSSRL